MHKTLFFFLVISVIFTGSIFAQDTLPRISVKISGNQVVVSWKNTFGLNISNINIQRSADSIKNFATIGTVLSPLNRENGFVDHKAGGANMFYRVFVAFEGGTYFFSRSHRPVIDTSHAVPDMPYEDLLPETKNHPKATTAAGFVPSKFIYTNRENNLIINLPDADKEKFSLHFFDDRDKKVLEISKIPETYLIVEKVNFLHSGWFYYNLYNDGILLEKYKFYISKDGRGGPPPPEVKNTGAPTEQ